jgi:hypothetical protein
VGKFLLLSILLATVVIPMRAASDRSPKRGFRRTIFFMAAFNVFYLIAIIYVLPRLPS